MEAETLPGFGEMVIPDKLPAVIFLEKVAEVVALNSTLVALFAGVLDINAIGSSNVVKLQVTTSLYPAIAPAGIVTV